jgi:hypothetical protein
MVARPSSGGDERAQDEEARKKPAYKAQAMISADSVRTRSAQFREAGARLQSILYPTLVGAGLLRKVTVLLTVFFQRLSKKARFYAG